MAALVCAAWGAHAGVDDFAQLNLDRIGDLSLEQLGNIRVTSVARRTQPLLQAPASVFVITAEDIRRSGARSLPEVLRLAPNLQVARTSANQWAISARGFNNAIGNKLLVLVDGRTIYSPLFSGVFWDAQDLVLEDIAQIEVISGPGGTLWGANAVNGVINVTTRPAGQTQGGLVAASAGDGDTQAVARWGGKLGGSGHYRVSALDIHRDNTTRTDGTAVADAAKMRQVALRADWGQPDNGVTLDAASYSGGSLPGTPEAPRLTGNHVLARWSQSHGDGSAWRLQGWYDHSRRQEPLTFNDDMEVFDVDWQHSPALSKTHKLLWGGGYRQARDLAATTLLVRFIPAQRDLRWANLFAQDEIALANKVALTLGAKMESNVYTGWEFLPSARLAWTPSDTQLGWAALSRAVRAPARLDRDFFLPGNPPFLIQGGPDFQSEVANVLELGWRAQPTPTLSYSATLFHHRYERLRSGQPPPAIVQNMISGTTTGLEAWAQWQVTTNWRLTAGANTLREHLHINPGSTDPTGPSALGNDPRYQWMLRSGLNVTPRHEFDVAVRRVGALPLPAVAAYTAVDVRWGWQVRHDVELSFNIQNLLDNSHIEFGAAPGASVQRRAGWMKLQWRM
ncbi:MAG TPA: TonB-dependent receptor [Ramlibacter sp.]|nr:TonB-dependent receptor [Ramlibacter sp.]